MLPRWNLGHGSPTKSTYGKMKKVAFSTVGFELISAAQDPSWGPTPVLGAPRE